MDDLRKNEFTPENTPENSTPSTNSKNETQDILLDQSDGDILSIGLSESLGTANSSSIAKSSSKENSNESQNSQNSTIDDIVAVYPSSSSTEVDPINLESDRSALNSSDIFIIEESEQVEDRPPIERSLESTDSDVRILDETDKNYNNSSTADVKSLNDSVQIISPNQNAPAENSSTLSEIVKSSSYETEKFISPVFSDTKTSTDRIIFDAHPTYSTPNEVKISKKEDSTESITNFSPVQKKLMIAVDISTMIYMNKDSWSGEITHISCDKLIEPSQTRLSDGSSNLADISKSTSPSSSTSLTLLPMKSNRFSVSSSGSSIMSSASDLARRIREKKLLTLNKKDDVKLSDERINELKQKWLHSSEIYKVLDFIDKIILNTDTVINDDSLKEKAVSEDSGKLEKIEEVCTPLSTNKVRPTRGKRQTKVKFSDSENEIPKKRQRRAESTDVLVASCNFSEGDSVFAKWSDRKFYAATLGKMTSDGKWQVNFFDGDKKTLLEEFLIKAEEFTMVGHGVYASQGDDKFTPGIITGCELKDEVLQYIVARDKGDISVASQFIYITESQARAIRGKSTVTIKSATKSENVILLSESKRSTRSKTRLLLDSPKPSSSGTQQTVLSDTDDDENDDNNINLEDVAGVEPESHGVYENGIKLKGKALTGKMRFSRTKTIDVNATVLGPVPEEGSKYFKNLHILLTCTRPQSPKNQVVHGSSSETLSSENESYNFSSIPFVKDRLKLQLQMGGAIVYNNFDEIPQKLWKNTYLISNRPNNSAIYVQCLAAGIKLVCHQWVIRCCTEKKKVPLQELPLGWSLERERYFMWTDRKSSSALKKLKLLIVDIGDKNFYKFWSKICKLAEIDVGKLTRDSNLEQICAIISEPGYRDDHVDRVITHNIPLVSTTWLIQSLLHGAPRQFDGHKKYLTEYVDSD